MNIEQVRAMQAEKDNLMRNEGSYLDPNDLLGGEYESAPDADQVRPYPY